MFPQYAFEGSFDFAPTVLDDVRCITDNETSLLDCFYNGGLYNCYSPLVVECEGMCLYAREATSSPRLSKLRSSLDSASNLYIVGLLHSNILRGAVPFWPSTIEVGVVHNSMLSDLLFVGITYSPYSNITSRVPQVECHKLHW